MRFVRRILVLACAVVAAPMLSAARDGLQAPYARTVSMERDLRLEPEAYAHKAGLEPEGFRSRYGASGLIRCGKAVGTGQITLAGNVITTAAHVFFAPGGKLRGNSCTFEPAYAPGAPVAIEMSSIVSGTPRPMEERATLDWAVARLASAPAKIVPYPIAIAPKAIEPVVMFGGGNGPAGRLGVERCSTRRVTATAPEGIRELAFDCSADHGGSGAALLNEQGEMIGIFVGYRSVDAATPLPFSDIHYNFAITVEGPFRRALLSAAKNQPRNRATD